MKFDLQEMLSRRLPTWKGLFKLLATVSMEFFAEEETFFNLLPAQWKGIGIKKPNRKTIGLK